MSNFEESTAAGHAHDEAAGFVEQVTAQLIACGYRDLQPLSCGRDARVFRARSPQNGDVVLRVGAPFAMTRWRNRPTFRNYLRLKMLAWFMPKHPNLVRYFRCFRLRFHDRSAGRDTPIYCLEMQYLDGRSLLDTLNESEFKRGGLAHIRKVVLEILSGWTALHHRGLRQGDLSPTNIVVCGNDCKSVLIDLRFSLRFWRTLDREHHELRCTLRALLTGCWRRDQDLSPLSLDTVYNFWQPHAQDPTARVELRKWAKFAERLGPGGELHLLSPPKLLEKAKKIAKRFESKTQNEPSLNHPLLTTHHSPLTTPATTDSRPRLGDAFLRSLKELGEFIYVAWLQSPRMAALNTKTRTLRIQRVIPHAGGAHNGVPYCNTLEVLERSATQGNVCVEVDLEFSSDGRLVLLHDWEDTAKRRLGAAQILTAEEFKQIRTLDGLTNLTFDDFAVWLRAHPDMLAILHLKRRLIPVLLKIKEKHFDLASRLIVHFEQFREYKEGRALGFDHLSLTLRGYTKGYTDRIVVMFARRFPLTFVLMPVNRATGSLPRRLWQAGTRTYAYTVNDEMTKEQLLANQVSGIYSDSLPLDGQFTENFRDTEDSNKLQNDIVH
ncbi:MAG: glycerophosphodiester phosphodiesterase family protein [Planctomycetota bacterium]